MNIIWKRQDDTLAVTSIMDGTDPSEFAASMKEQGIIPADWQAVAFGIDQFPPAPQEAWRFVDGAIVFDSVALFESQRENYFASEVRPKREIVLSRLGDIAGRLSRKGDAAGAQSCDTAAEALLNITTDATVMAATDMDGLKQAVLAYYWQTAGSLPDEIKSAFNGVDA